MINLIGWPVFAVLTLIAITIPRLRWLAATLATMLLVNAVLHALGTLVTQAYSPGLATALLLYPAPCVAALRMTSKAAPASFTPAVVAGLVLHGAVLIAAFA